MGSFQTKSILRNIAEFEIILEFQELDEEGIFLLLMMIPIIYQPRDEVIR